MITLFLQWVFRNVVPKFTLNQAFPATNIIEKYPKLTRNTGIMVK